MLVCPVSTLMSHPAFIKVMCDVYQISDYRILLWNELEKDPSLIEKAMAFLVLKLPHDCNNDVVWQSMTKTGKPIYYPTGMHPGVSTIIATSTTREALDKYLQIQTS